MSHVPLIRKTYQVEISALTFILPNDLGCTGFLKLAWFLLAAIVAPALANLGRVSFSRDAKRSIVTQWLVSLAVFTLVFAGFGVASVPLRHLIVVDPSSVLVALLFMWSLTRMRTAAYSLSVILLACLSAEELWEQYHQLNKPGDWQHVAAMLPAAAYSTPTVILPPESVVPLRVHLAGPVIPLPRPMLFTYGYVSATVMADESQVAKGNDDCRATVLDDSSTGCSFIEANLSRHYRALRISHFRGALVRLYLRLPAYVTTRERRTTTVPFPFTEPWTGVVITHYEVPDRSADRARFSNFTDRRLDRPCRLFHAEIHHCKFLFLSKAQLARWSTKHFPAPMRWCWH